MIGKEFIFLLLLVLIVRVRTLPTHWFYFGLVWFTLFVVYSVVSFLVNLPYLPSLNIGFTTELFAIMTLPLCIILIAAEENRELAFRVTKWLLILNFAVLACEVSIGNVLHQSGLGYFLGKFAVVLRPADGGYPGHRNLLGFFFLRPVGAFRSSHVSCYILVLYYAFLAFEDENHPAKKPRSLLKTLVVLVLFATNNIQAILSFVVFWFAHSFFRRSWVYKMLFTAGSALLLSPMFVAYFANNKFNVAALLRVFWAYAAQIESRVLVFGLLAHPLNLDNKDFLISMGIRPDGFLFDIGPYLLLTRYGIVGMVLLTMFFASIMLVVRRRGQRMILCLLAASAVTFIHYPVVFSAAGTFALCSLILYADRRIVLVPVQPQPAVA